jgi:hypothetical protein
LKEAFLSPFHDELAFKKLESYTQGLNQPVRSFYNEVLKLCSETDSEMSESMKLRHLLKKAKPTLQYEIRKKKPTTTKQFLEYAKESEELFQLSNLDPEVGTYDHNNSNPTNQITSTGPATRGNTSNSYMPGNPRPTQDRQGNYKNYNNNNYNNNNNNNNKYNNNRTNDYKYNSSQRNNSSYSSDPSTKSNQQFRYNNQRTNYNSRPTTSTNETRPFYKYNNNIDSANQNNIPTHQVNNITTTDTISSSQPTPQSSTSDFCTRCQDPGHQADACPHF